MDVEESEVDLIPLENQMDPLANSSFQSGSENIDDVDLAAQLAISANTPHTPPLATAPNQEVDMDIDLDTDVHMGEIPKLNHDVGVGLKKEDTLDTPNISVIGLEPIQSPRKAIQKILSQPVSDKPRLVIEKLVLTNFKSYAGRQEIGPFHPSFSAVVGPNGSGKSNVIDSMLFVFGFRASKMRQSKLKELIHNSESFPDLEFCQVDIHFQKIIDNFGPDQNSPGKPTVVKDSELIVSRRANKNNSSTYYINNRTSSYKEVTTLLKEEGIDLDHKRFLILQGEVEMIAQMKPKAENDNDDGLLEYLEDIIGTSVYKEEIEKISNEIEILQDSYNDKKRRFEFTQTDFKDIEDQKDRAINFLKLEKKYKDETVKYWYLTSYSESKSIERHKIKLDELNDSIKGDKKLTEESNKKLLGLKGQKTSLNSKLNEINVAINKAKSNYKSIEKEQVSLTENLKINRKKSSNLTKNLESNKKVLASNELELRDLIEGISNYDNVIYDLDKTLTVENNKLDEIKASLSSETKKYSNQIEKLQKELEPWKNDIDKIQSDCNIKKSEIELLQNQLTSLLNENDRVKLLLTEKTEQIKINDSKIETLYNKKEKFQSDIDKHKNTFRFAGNELKRLEIELKEISDKVQETRNRVSTHETQNKVLAALTRLQETGRISGFYGRLGDLGIIDDKYDVAVSTGGGALSDYVVETVEDAQNCIQYLRQNNLGFGKFIVLQKLRRFNLNKINTPENVPRLFDLIKPIDPKFAPAFYSSMYDTLVAPNLSVANRVAFGGSKRWRVVTLDGKLVDVSGTMSGGGSRVNKGAMKLTSNSTSHLDISPQQLQDWKDDLHKKEENYRNAEAAYRKMDQVLLASQEEIPKMASEILKLQMENKTLVDEIKDLENTAKELSKNKAESSSLKSQIENESKLLKKLETSKVKIEEGCHDLQKQIDDLNKKILDIGGLKLKTQTAKVQLLKEEIKLKIEMKENNELKIAKLQNQNLKSNKLIESMEIQINDLQLVVEKLEKKCNNKKIEVQKIENALENLNADKSTISNEISELDDEIEEVEAKLRENSELINESLKQINKIESIIKKVQVEVDYAKESIESIEYRDINEYIGWLDPEDPLRAEIVQTPISYENKFTENELREIDLKQLGENVDNLKVELSDTTVNLDILVTYGEKVENYNDQKREVENSEKTLKEIKEKNEELNDRRYNEFKEGFVQISDTLKHMYSLITAGGMAELEYYDSHDPFAEGVLFSVMPPKKTWRAISNLSGGEKTLASLALVFALHHYKPTPLYVMDEIDAALDFKNVSIVANYIKQRTKNAQFIVISLRNNMFELAERLVGIYKVNNMTRSATLINKDFIK